MVGCPLILPEIHWVWLFRRAINRLRAAFERGAVWLVGQQRPEHHAERLPATGPPCRWTHPACQDFGLLAPLATEHRARVCPLDIHLGDRPRSRRTFQGR